MAERWAVGKSHSGTGRRTARMLARSVCKRTSVWYVVAIWNWCRSWSELLAKWSTSAKNYLPIDAGTARPSCCRRTTWLTLLGVLLSTHHHFVVALCCKINMFQNTLPPEWWMVTNNEYQDLPLTFRNCKNLGTERKITILKCGQCPGWGVFKLKVIAVKKLYGKKTPCIGW